jgi:glucosamine--fructose-6-phosphate aminotransferase (isomerizing)
MCGITGIVAQRNICEELFEGMQNLEYRGYDSAGMAVLYNGRLEVRKDAGTLAAVEGRQRLSTMYGSVGIAHTRWATHGGVCQANAHPHSSADGCFAIVHNGVIENYLALKTVLQQQGYTFQSETDSEVIVQLIAAYHTQGYSVEEALVAVTRQLQGTFAFALLTTHAPEILWCARRESPLVIGVGEGTLYLASDVNAFARYTHQAVFLNDDEYAALHPHDYTIKSLRTTATLTRTPTHIAWRNGHGAEKGSYPHFMLKEIHEGADCVDTALAIPKAEITALTQRLQDSHGLYFTGMGTAYYVALLAQYYFATLATCYVPVLSADEFPILGQVGPGSLTLAVSQSGETYDTLKALRYAKAQGSETAAVVNVPGSSMVREVQHVILQGAGPEICVLSTKSMISQLTILLRLALELGRQRGHLDAARYAEHSRALTALPATLRRLYTELAPHIQRVGHTCSQIPNWLFIGRGIYSAVALESALKFKEVSYLHAEGMSGGFLKHGTIALVDAHTYSLAFLPTAEEPALLHATLTNIQEIRAHSGLVIGIHQQQDPDLRTYFADEIIVPATPALVTPFVQLTVGQMLAYYTALALGRNIDQPRSLAKSVTVV